VHTVSCASVGLREAPQGIPRTAVKVSLASNLLDAVPALDLPLLRSL